MPSEDRRHQKQETDDGSDDRHAHVQGAGGAAAAATTTTTTTTFSPPPTAERERRIRLKSESIADCYKVELKERFDPEDPSLEAEVYSLLGEFFTTDATVSGLHLDAESATYFYRQAHSPTPTLIPIAYTLYPIPYTLITIP